MTYKIKVKNLNKLRKNILIQGLTVKEFAKETEINYGYLISILNGKRTPSPKLAKQISQKLNKNVDDIFFI
ncbi:helix-turn-helix transcriptional regulator [Pediococcus inopinatus]|uniref:helix-turn-helix transcriptional regulator n=1 Tax=Pediococcus inopinatus TaxID=114090 RepID=UPI000708E0D4|nr:helix-turn-helix transcriptional regulator [Pediococcus inopinatus]